MDPANNRKGIYDILLEKGKIGKIARNISIASTKTIDAKGKIVMPGLIDMHVHLREPGREDKETIAAGTSAALKGGITSLLTMPNTTPAIDCPENIKLLKRLIQTDAKANVFIAGTITLGRKGEKLSEIAKLKQQGALAITDDGASVDNNALFLKALELARENNLLVICHSEDKALSKNGVVNLGITSTRMGVRGISCDSEYKRVQRDIRLAERSKAAVHIAHLSCKESVEIVAQAKKRGVKVTAETAPHYFALTEEAVLGFDTNTKMNPPLRSQGDLEAIKQGLKNGVIDVIASDHAPHTENEKDIEFERAAFGVIGLETELALGITELVGKGILDWSGLVKVMSANPARILGLDKGSLGLERDADVIIVSPDEQWQLKKEEIVSKSKNSPFIGKRLKGRVEYTICGGKVVYTKRK